VPHMKFEGDLDIETVWTNPPALTIAVPEEDLHAKFAESYLNPSRDVLLLRYILIEGRLNQTVPIVLAISRGEWVLKLDNSAPVLRTPGVKLLLAAVGAWLQVRGLAKTSSTVEAYEDRGRFYVVHGIGKE